MAPAEREDFLQISVAVIFAPSGLGGHTFQIRVAQKLIEERGIAAALRGELRVFVKALAAREMQHQADDEHVCGSGGESETLLSLGCARASGEVGHADETQRDAAP